MSIESNTNNTILDIDYLYKYIDNLTSKSDIKQWDLGASSSKDFSVQVDRGEAKQLKASQRSSITVRVWNNQGLVGITSTSDLSDNGLIKAFKGAYDASKFGNPNEIPNFSPLAKSQLPKLSKPIIEFQGIKNLLNILKNAENDLLNQHKSIKTIPYNGLGETSYNRIYLNSEGARRRISGTQASLYLYARAEENGKKPRSSGSIRIAHGVRDLDIEGCIQEAASRTISHLKYQSIETGKYLVCFKPEAFLELIVSFSSMFNARSILDGVSLSKKDSIGSDISVPYLSIFDDPLNPSNFSSCNFDGEGTPTSKLCLVNSGKIKNFLHSEATARYFGVQPTGHAGLGAKVSVGADWLVVKREYDHADIHENLVHNKYKGSFILIEGLNALHAGIKASQGSFSLPFDGWLVQNGEKTSIEAATVAGDIRDVLKRIVQIEKTQIITHQGISPHVWVENLSITGEE